MSRARLYLEEIAHARKRIDQAEAREAEARQRAEEARRAAAGDANEAPPASGAGSGTAAGVKATTTPQPAAWKRPLGWTSLVIGVIGAGVGGWLLYDAVQGQTALDNELGVGGVVFTMSYDTYRAREEGLNADIVRGHAVLWPGVALTALGVGLVVSGAPPAKVSWTPLDGGGIGSATLRF
jgi:hypothetical protein